MSRLSVLLAFLLHIFICAALPKLVQQDGRTVSASVFKSLEELSRIVDISYCVGSTGLSKPFECWGRCKDFPGFELVTSWNTGILLSDSCGYIALSHPPYKKRVIVAFRGTYSIANTIADLSTTPAVYAPFPANGDDSTICPQVEDHEDKELWPPLLSKQHNKRFDPQDKCLNCTVHSGFLKSWHNTRCTIIPHVERALAAYPDYELTLVGHSLGGSVAALAGLELQARGWNPHVTTFGEPRIGNLALNKFIDRRFNLNSTSIEDALYRRVTHIDDPVPLLPPEEWGYRMHAGEIYISKPSLPPALSDLEHCSGDEDPHCIAGGASVDPNEMTDINKDDDETFHENDFPTIPNRYKLWQLFFAHRDYFWRLGFCVPDFDPWHWSGLQDIEKAQDEVFEDLK